VRDVEELAELGLPIWARFVRAQGATKGEVGELDVPVVIGGVEIRPGDVVVMGLRRRHVAPERAAGSSAALALERAEKELAMRQRYAAGELSYDLNGLREIVEG